MERRVSRPADVLPTSALVDEMTMPPRLRRLQADYAQLTAAFAGHPAVRVEPLGPMPPERYRILYAVAGLRLWPDRQVWRAYQHVLDIYLPPAYPW